MSLDISKIAKKLLIQEGFFGNLLLGLNKYEDENIPTACVALEGINTALHINPKFWNSLKSDEERVSILKHELLHLGYFHLLMLKDFKNHVLFNIAADCEINQYIQNLPKDCIFIDNLEKEYKCTLNRKAGTKYYYNELEKLQDNNQDFADFCTSLGDIHPLWKEFEKLTPAQKNLVQKQIEHQLKEAYESSEKSRGTLPGGLEDAIKKLLTKEPPTVNWKEVFKRYTGGSYEVFTKKSRRKESKRFEGNPGIKVKNKLKGLVCIDTSGSVSDKDLQLFFNEIDHLVKTGVQIDLLQFDSAFQCINKYKVNQELVKIKGRGGTEFDCAVEYYNSHKKDYGFMVLFTDGFAPLPNIKPAKHMMWVITKNGDAAKNYPYYKVKMNY